MSPVVEQTEKSNIDKALATFVGFSDDYALRVIKDDGLYRHLAVRRPKDSFYSFQIATWPGHIAISGDLGCLVLSREEDMLAFVAGGGAPDFQYLAQKVQASDGGTREWSPRLFAEAVKSDYAMHITETDDGAEPLPDEDEKSDERKSAEAAIWARIEDVVLDDAEDEHAALGAVQAFETTDFEDETLPYASSLFTDFWDRSLYELKFQVALQLLAMQWAANAYRAEPGDPGMVA